MRETPLEITAIEVEGFKSIRQRQRLEMKPLTIIAGANSSGKSSFMQPLLLLKQTLESPFRPSVLVLDGNHVRFSDPAQLLSRCSPPAERFEVFSVQIKHRAFGQLTRLIQNLVCLSTYQI